MNVIALEYHHRGGSPPGVLLGSDPHGCPCTTFDAMEPCRGLASAAHSVLGCPSLGGDDGPCRVLLQH
jgi:hypothetical protein